MRCVQTLQMEPTRIERDMQLHTHHGMLRCTPTANPQTEANCTALQPPHSRQLAAHQLQSHNPKQTVQLSNHPAAQRFGCWPKLYPHILFTVVTGKSLNRHSAVPGCPNVEFTRKPISCSSSLPAVTASTHMLSAVAASIKSVNLKATALVLTRQCCPMLQHNLLAASAATIDSIDNTSPKQQPLAIHMYQAAAV
jgi:hypothetical protein